MFRDVYSEFLRLNGEEDADTLRAALNYAGSLLVLQRFEEAKEYLREKVPLARSALGENNEITIRMRWIYATALYKAAAATLDDLREAVATLEEIERIARRVFGGAHPTTALIEASLGESRAALRARETPSPAGSARDPSAADDDATPAAPAASAGSGPDGSSGEALASARDAEAFLK